ncbi:MAG: helix-turn-helix domain-containing protein [Pseudonocardiaceae bacterium]
MPTRSIGGRIREVRLWRDMTLQATAELAGITEGYLSRIERNQRPVNSRSLLERIAAALRVAPSELAGQAFPPPTADPVASETQAAVVDLEAALSDYRLGEPTGEMARPWPAVAADLDRLNSVLRPAADYAALGALLPGLLTELHTLYVTDPQHRVDVCTALMGCYHTAGILLKSLGIRGLPSLAAFRAQQVAEELDDPAWLGLATWLRASTLGGMSRPRMLAISLRGANELERHLDDPRAAQMYGALHLNAAWASAAMRRGGDAADHLDEATAIAERVGGEAGAGSATGTRGFGGLCFGPDNVGIWRVSVAVELGEGGRAREIAGLVNPSRVRSALRQSAFWADLGRGMAQERSTRHEAVGALLRAEKIAPQYVRTNPFVRETIADLMRRAQRDASEGRDLRGMAYRMGICIG